MSFVVWIIVLISYIACLSTYCQDFASNNIVLVYYIGVIVYLGFESYWSYRENEKMNKILDKKLSTVKFYFFKIYISKIISTSIHLIILLLPFLFVSLNIISKDQIFENTFLLVVIVYYIVLFAKVMPSYYDIKSIDKKIQDKIVE